MVRLKSKFIIFFLIFILALTLIGCSASKDESKMLDVEPNNYETENTADLSNGFGNQETEAKENNQPSETNSYGNKVIKTAFIELETKNFDYVTDSINNMVTVFGGYTESSNITGKRIVYKGNIQNRNASFKLRVPKEKFNEFVLGFNSLGNVITSRTSGDDITSNYFDTEARVKALEIQEERLLEILKKAVKIGDIIELERELSNVRYQIENLTGTLRKWDNLVDFSTIEVNVYEVQEITEPEEEPVTLGQKISNGFNKSVELLVRLFKGLLVILAAILPFVVIIVPIILIVRFIMKRRNKNARKKD